jgi:hypothetical protein
LATLPATSIRNGSARSASSAYGYEPRARPRRNHTDDGNDHGGERVRQRTPDHRLRVELRQVRPRDGKEEQPDERRLYREIQPECRPHTTHVTIVTAGR